MHVIVLESACLVIVCTLQLRRSHLHLTESQRVVTTRELIPVNAAKVVGVSLIIATVQIGHMTGVVPPGTTALHCTWSAWTVVVLVSSAEFLSEMVSQCITFRQQTLYKYISPVALTFMQVYTVHVVNESEYLTQDIAYVIKIHMLYE